MKNAIFILTVLFFVSGCEPGYRKAKQPGVKSKLTRLELIDKIKGGWAGQVIGCTFGGPTEFRFRGSMIHDYQPIPWDENRCRWYFENSPGLYDDVYMDLTFVDVFEKKGLDAPASAHALAFANAEYSLWHANQAARYNILNGIMPPRSGHWLNNPHADDIDFQIEADFAGLMAPGLPQAAIAFADSVGHIVNSGDGWYGGVYVAAMYSLAFISSDIEYVVTEALKAIPVESQFYRCISDVIAWWKKYPSDWKQTWFEAQRSWAQDVGCPEGVFDSFNIDAKINAAYIVIGLLYGQSDFSKTLEISTRCGQDSDCNPASAGGILGTMLGYNRIPEFWRKGVYQVEDMDFKYTTMSLDDVYEIGTRHALKVLELNSSKITDEFIEIPVQKVVPVRFEASFPGHYPVSRNRIGKILDSRNRELEIEFKGNGFVLLGGIQKIKTGEVPDAVLNLEMTVDSNQPEPFGMPTLYGRRRLEIGWKYKLQDEKHTVRFKLLNPSAEYRISVSDLIVYSSQEVKNAWKSDD